MGRICLAIVLTGLTGCNGALEVLQPPPPPEEPPPAKIERADGTAWQLEELKCPEGRPRMDTQENGGVEQWCMRDKEPHGPYGRWHSNGEREVRGKYSNGKETGVWTWWDEEARESIKGKYVDGKKYGGWTWWHPNGKAKQVGDFQNGMRVGQWTLYHENGQPHESGNYVNDEKDDVWTIANEEGEIENYEEWKRGEKVGEGKYVPQ
jgi:antitoxin component YwqK of YwqJK toxin-antitoxin module